MFGGDALQRGEKRVLSIRNRIPCDIITPMLTEPEFIDTELKESIAEAVHEFAQQKQLDGIKSLSRYNPQKVGMILYLFSQGVSQSQMVKKYNLSHQTIKHTIIEYADHAGEWAKLSAKISRTLFLELSSILLLQSSIQPRSGDIK